MATEPTSTPAAVDTTSLATSPLERRDSLEKHLLTRPDPQDLKERHILLDTNVAPYVLSCPVSLHTHMVSIRSTLFLAKSTGWSTSSELTMLVSALAP